MPLLMKLYTSPDYRFLLDPNTKVQSDKRIYAEVSNANAKFVVDDAHSVCLSEI